MFFISKLNWFNRECAVVFLCDVTCAFFLLLPHQSVYLLSFRRLLVILFLQFSCVRAHEDDSFVFCQSHRNRCINWNPHSRPVAFHLVFLLLVFFFSVAAPETNSTGFWDVSNAMKLDHCSGSLVKPHFTISVCHDRLFFVQPYPFFSALSPAFLNAIN